MRLAATEGRALLVTNAGREEVIGLDIEQSSKGRFPADPQLLYDMWVDLRAWAATASVGNKRVVDYASLTSPVPRPRQVFAVGLNYRDHAQEVGLSTERGSLPRTFCKYPTSLAGPYGDLELSGMTVDWEIEMVVVMGRCADHVPAARALEYVAGYAVGQDFTDRTLQWEGGTSTQMLAKCFRGYGPIGPWLVTGDEIADAADLELVCEVNGEQVQKGRTSDMIWTVPEIIEALSSITLLLPGDVLFTGTPAGVGMSCKPPRYLAPGDEVISCISGIGRIHQKCRASRRYS